MKRQRGRGRGNKPGGHHQPNRNLESSGPDGKVRGPASYIYERYLQAARDASSSGDRVMAENYLQHAEHYFRVLRAMQPAMPPPQTDRFGSDMDFEGDDEGAEGEGGEMEGAVGEANAEQPEVEFPGEQQQRSQQQEFGNREEGGFRRRRGRRNRFRPEGEREGGFEGAPREGGEQREEREPREQRAEREPREPRAEREPREPRPQGEGRRERAPRERAEGEAGSGEGFSHGPKPAFLGSD
ncbi:MAG TPA: DUF4167 domain-containing protein [Caulobacterales bacterium]|nr:DUF4167 domain-containing protein [Caulobacterales bacterium]